MEQNRAYEHMDSRELLAALLRSQKRHAWVNTVLTCLLAALLVTVLIALPRALRTLEGVEQTLRQVDAFVENANEMVSANADSVTEAMEKLNGLDFDALNQAIGDLSEAVKPLANLARYFH